VLFDGTTGANPRGKLAIDANGNLIVTIEGNTIFELSSSGTFTTIARFSGSHGIGLVPVGGLLRGAAGNLFGTTVNGGDTVFGSNTEEGPCSS
jgi:hypothetical protein